jgi:hypothetical protein
MRAIAKKITVETLGRLKYYLHRQKNRTTENKWVCNPFILSAMTIYKEKEDWKNEQLKK